MLKLTNQADGTLELLVYGVIGESWFGDGLSALDVATRLAESPNADVFGRVHSPGGSVTDGFAIFNALKAHKGKVTMRVESIAASIASYICMAADDIEIAENAEFMIHDARTQQGGTADELKRDAERADRISNVIASAYAKRAGKEVSEVREVMKAETYFDAAGAVEFGLADRVVDFDTEGLAAFGDREMEFMRNTFQRMPRMPNVALVAASNGGRGAEEPAPIPQQAPNAGQKEQSEMALKTMLASAFALDVAADDSALVASITAVKTDNERLAAELKASQAAFAAVESALGVTGGGVLGAIAEHKGARDSLTATQAELAELKQKAATDGHKALVNKAFTAGRLTAIEQAWALTQTPEVVNGFLTARGDNTVIPPQPSDELQVSPDALTAYERNLCKQSNISEAEFLAARKAGS